MNQLGRLLMSFFAAGSCLGFDDSEDKPHSMLLPAPYFFTVDVLRNCRSRMVQKEGCDGEKSNPVQTKDMQQSFSGIRRTEITGFGWRKTVRESYNTE